MESNHLPSAYQTDALPVEPRAYEVGAEGIAPQTSRVLTGRSSSLSYAPSSRCAVFKVLAFVDPVGFEPTASWVQARRSSVLELQAHRRDGGTRTPNPRIPNPVRCRCATSRWSRRRESNPRLHRGTVTCSSFAPRPHDLFNCSRTGGRDRTPVCWVGASRAPTTPRPFEGKTKRLSSSRREPVNGNDDGLRLREASDLRVRPTRALTLI